MRNTIVLVLIMIFIIGCSREAEVHVRNNTSSILSINIDDSIYDNEKLVLYQDSEKGVAVEWSSNIPFAGTSHEITLTAKSLSGIVLVDLRRVDIDDGTTYDWNINEDGTYLFEISENDPISINQQWIVHP